ncbi:MAG: TdeIII family type II restriction endonuclease [Chthonomonadetes bacterium]|nr:TdeIII family type II restriction endonuclease [Chthonomonadetes bacterium]
MPAISQQTRERIRGYLEGFIGGLVEAYKNWYPPTYGSVQQYLGQRSAKGTLKPFHHAIMPVELLKINAFERSFSTKLGTTFEECARLIASEHHEQAVRGYSMEGQVSQSALNEIENLVRRLGEPASEPLSLASMVEDVLAHRREDDLVHIRVISDLYVRKHSGEEMFFEIKSPKPNKDQCEKALKRLLQIHLLRGATCPAVSAYFAMAYNPFGDGREEYRWSILSQYPPLMEAAVIADEFWSLIGGAGTYEELLQIYQEVGNLRSRFILDALVRSAE